MSRAPSTDTDLWDRRPVDVGEELGVISARAHASEPQDAASGGTGVPARQPASAPTRAIPDDWDDDPSSSGEEDSQKIWEHANKAGPMPELVSASSRTGSTPNVVPPASAFQSPIRILKRSLVPPPKHTNASPSTSATFAERSAQYNAARERIFADTTEGKVGGGDRGAASLVVRNPRGPGDSPGPNGRGREGSHGFAERVASQRSEPSTLEQKE